MSDKPKNGAAAGALTMPRCSGKAAADFIGFSATWLSKLEKQNYLNRGPDDLFDLGEVFLGYIAFLRDDSRRNSRTAMARRKDEASARRIEIANAQAMAELIPMDTVLEFFAETNAMLSAEINATPAAIARNDLELRARIEAYINGCFERANARFQAARANWERGKPTFAQEEEAEDDDE